MDKTIRMELLDLIYDMAKAEPDVDLEIEVVTPLIKVSPEAAKEVAPKVMYSFKKLESHVKTLRTAHEGCVGKIKR